MTDVITRAAAAIRSCCDATAPTIGIVLGSGLGGLVSHIEHAKRVAFSELPGLPVPATPGHAGAFVYGMLCDREIVAVAGRLHLYEGVDPEAVGIPIRILAALGVRILVLSNAAGGIRPDLTPGTLMLLSDHLDLTGRPPLMGRSAPTYDVELAGAMRGAASAAGVMLSEGVYAAMLGPSYETAAEIRMLSTLGADAVGMSTVPEVIVAASLGMRVAAISCITNHATGTSAETLSHTEVLAVTSRVAPQFERVIRRFVARI
ncbi:MAG TPA: purine-nucleoside phosphorylase [Gemmatimonadaceae bacterium]|nr:purine-nucleoside phosphorylase [Gemmatimonadaceae bacterium]